MHPDRIIFKLQMRKVDEMANLNLNLNLITIRPMKGPCFYILKNKKSCVAAQDELVSPAHWRWKERDQKREECRRYFALVVVSRSESALASLPTFSSSPEH